MARLNPWMKLSLDAWALSLEASTVIGLRTLTLARGGPIADAEARRMVREKVEAGLQLQSRALTGELGVTPQAIAAKTLSHYRGKVRANRRRLTP